MKNKLIKTISASVLAIALSTSMFSTITYASEKERVTLGVNLNDYQKSQMLNEFGVSKDKVTVDTINNEDIISQLGLDPNDEANKKGGCYSSSYVKLTESGGVSVQANNLTEVTSLMLSNALITCGITNAQIKASSPFPVTGTSALAGILKGFEAANGQEISLKNKKAAQEEVETTSSLGDTIGHDEAAKVVSDIKNDVIKKAPKSTEEVNKLVNKALSDYTVKIPDEEKQKIVNLMVNINNLNINYDKVKDNLNNVGNEISKVLKDSGKKIQDSGIFHSIMKAIANFFGDLFSWIGNKLKSIF